MDVPWRQVATSSVKVTLHNIEIRISFSESKFLFESNS